MLSKLPLIGRVLGIVLRVIGVIMFIMVSLNEDSASSYVSYGLFTTVIGVVIAVLSFVLSLTVNPKGIRGVGIGLAAVIVVGILSYVLADGSDFASYKNVTESETKVVSAMLNAFYIIGAGAVLAVVYSLVSRVSK
jgi:drug/metabolite transporter (DMT)-like permease